MDLFPLWNSLRVAAISTVIVFFAGVFAAYYIARLPRLAKGVLDVVLTLPLVLPPTVIGYLLLRLLGPKRILGAWLLRHFGVKVVMTWWSAIFATAVVIFPLMYRTARGAFEACPLTRRWPTPDRRWDFPTAIFSGGSGCPAADRVFWRDGAGLCAGLGRVRRYQHDRRVHPRQDRHHLHHGLPALADQ